MFLVQRRVTLRVGWVPLRSKKSHHSDAPDGGITRYAREPTLHVCKDFYFEWGGSVGVGWVLCGAKIPPSDGPNGGITRFAREPTLHDAKRPIVNLTRRKR
jgi:hypothetical protein